MIDNMIEILKNSLNEQEIPCTDEIYSRIDGFYDLLMEKNRVMDLTNITEPREVALRHMADSLFLLKCADFKGRKVLDIGTGAGFPGFPLLMYLPELNITMLDSTAKRIEFINDAISTMKTPQTPFAKANAIACRAEDLGCDKKHRETFDIVCSRAVAPLNILCELAIPLVKEGGLMLAMKSDNDEGDLELKQAQKAVSLLGGKVIDFINYRLAPDVPPRRIVIIKKIGKTPLQYPRKYARIKAKPIE